MTAGSSAFWQGWVAWDVTNIMALKFCRSNNYTPFHSWCVHIHCQFSVYFWPPSRRSVMVCMCPYWIWLHGFASYHMLQLLPYRKGKSNSSYHSHNCSRLVVNLTLPKYFVPILSKHIFLGQVCMLAIWSHIVPPVCNLGVKYFYSIRDFFFSVQWGLWNLNVAFFLLPHCKLYHSTCFATAPLCSYSMITFFSCEQFISSRLTLHVIVLLQLRSFLVLDQSSTFSITPHSQPFLLILLCSFTFLSFLPFHQLFQCLLHKTSIAIPPLLSYL